MPESVLIEKSPPVGWITLNRPDRRNALTLEAMTLLTEKLEEIGADPEVNVLVLRGEGPAFCAGHDMKEMSEGGEDIHYFRRVATTCTRMMMALHRVPQPVIAQVHGVAMGAGCQMVATCDLAAASDDARFATPGVKIGLFCLTPMVPLIRAVGRKRALDMLFTGRLVPAPEAERFGLVNRVVQAQDLASSVSEWAAEIGAHSRFVLSLGKEVFYRQAELDEEAAIGYAKEMFALNCLAEDFREGFSAFLEKREPRWRNR
jgi:enoyl-CoA hydratase/carnithine racemase